MLAIIGIVAGLALPALVRSQDASKEASAIGSIRAIFTSQMAYSATAGNGNFGTLEELAASGYLDGAVVDGISNDYEFSLSEDGTSFAVSARPLGPNAAQMRSFYCDETGMIRWAIGAPANASSPVLGN